MGGEKSKLKGAIGRTTKRGRNEDILQDRLYIDMENVYDDIGVWVDVNNDEEHDAEESEDHCLFTGLKRRCSELEKKHIDLVEESTNFSEYEQLPRLCALSNDEKQLLLAAEKNDETQLTYLIVEKKVNVNVSDDCGMTALHRASYFNRKDIVVSLLIHEANVNAETNRGFTSLHCACMEGHYDTVCCLLENSADIDKKSKLGFTALHFACQEGYYDIVEHLLWKGADLTIPSEDGLMALHYACYEGHVYIGQTLIDAFPKIKNTEAKGGVTPAYLAAKSNQLEFLEMLIANHADITKTTERIKLSPIHVAAENGHTKIVETILQTGRENVDVMDANGRTSIYFATKGKHVECFQTLIKWNPKVDIPTEIKKNCPLHIAATNGCQEIASVLIEKGANINAENRNGYTPLHLASANGHANLVELLINKGADVDIQSKNGRTPLHACCLKENNSDCLNILLRANVKTELIDHNGDTPASMCLKYKLIESLAVLIEFGAKVDNYDNSILHIICSKQIRTVYSSVISSVQDINITDQKGQTALHLACEKCDEELVREILKRQPDLNLKRRSDDFTPLHIASFKGNAVIAKLLLESKKTSIDQIATNKATALHVACEHKHKGVVELLLQNKASLYLKTEKHGSTPLHIACVKGDVDTVKIILSAIKPKKFTTNPIFMTDKKGRTPLLLAAYYSSSRSLANLLVDNKSKPADIDLDGNNALHLACMADQVAIADYISDKVKIDSTNNENNTALHIACQHGNVNMVKILLRRNPSIMINNKLGQTAVDVTNSREIEKLLKGEYGASMMIEDFYFITKDCPRGICLVINNENFEKSARRSGSNHDVDCINKLFTDFNYDVIIEKDIGVQRMKTSIIEIAERDHSNFDSFVLFIMSHGHDNEVIGSDDMHVKFKDLIQPLYQCKSLMEKPKLIFVQACRGDKIGRTDGNNRLKEDKADFLTAFCTCPKEVAWRQRDNNGSYFIQILCQQLKLHGTSKDINHILVMVTKLVKNQVNEVEQAEQVPEYVSSLDKLFRFK